MQRVFSIQGRPDRSGFSLIELVIVVVIIGVIGAIAIPRLSRGSSAARTNAFVRELNALAQAVDHYHAEGGPIIGDSSSGLLPPELKGRVRQAEWEAGTPLGGQWDIEVDSFGMPGVSLGVHFNGVPFQNEPLVEVDRLLDDGDLDAGRFRQIDTDRFYLSLN